MTIPRIPAFVLPMAVAGAVIVGHLAIGPEAVDDGSAPASGRQKLVATPVVTGDARRSGPSLVGKGRTPPAYPRRSAIAAARSYLRGRDGYTAFAVIDSEGRMRGSHLHRTFVSASVVKAMLLVAYLREVAGAHRRLDEEDRELLQPMIHYSDNEAASAVWERVGNPRLRALARRAGMTDFSIEGDWASAQISAADQARYFFGMRKLIPARFRHLADHLLSHIAGYESWGVPAVARPRGWRVYFKGGWRGTSRGQLVHQIAWLRKPHERVAIAVMTDGDPSMEYGIDTIQGVARRLLGALPGRVRRNPRYARRTANSSRHLRADGAGSSNSSWRRNQNDPGASGQPSGLSSSSDWPP
jgi:beta-lactamase class A